MTHSSSADLGKCYTLGGDIFFDMKSFSQHPSYHITETSVQFTYTHRPTRATWEGEDYTRVGDLCQVS